MFDTISTTPPPTPSTPSKVRVSKPTTNAEKVQYFMGQDGAQAVLLRDTDDEHFGGDASLRAKMKSIAEMTQHADTETIRIVWNSHTFLACKGKAGEHFVLAMMTGDALAKCAQRMINGKIKGARRRD